MELVTFASGMYRSLLSGGAPAAGSSFCLDKNVTYQHRVDNPEGWNWCLTPDGGYDAVFFASIAIFVMCLASPRWDALIVLFLGGIYFTFSYYWNLEHVSNAVMLWLGMRPADIFVFVFLPPFLLDLSVRIDFFMLKKVAFNIAFMAFVMVAASALILIPFMLYALDLKSSGWSAAHVALFGSMIASTDAASVSAVLRGGGGPEILSVLLEGESLFNDASSLTLFEIFKELVLAEESSTLAHDINNIVVKTIWSAFVGIAVGWAMGIFTRWIYAWLQYRNMEAMAEVSWSVAGAYLSFYIAQVWCKGSGCIGSVAFGLYGSATLLWGMSTKARLSGIFIQFWAVVTFIINGLIFFYVGASAVNFTIRSTTTLFSEGRIELVKILLYKLPLIYLASFSLRFILIFASFKLFQLVRLSAGLSIQEVIFVTVGGLRGSLSLVLAQSAATLASTHQQNMQVKAEIAIYTAGYVIMTLIINAPLCGPLLTLLGLDRVRQEQLAMRGEVKNLFRKFTSTAIEDLAAGQDEDELLQGLDWAMLRQHTDFDKQLDKELPEVQPKVEWCRWAWTGYGKLFSAPMRWWRKIGCTSGGASLDTVPNDQLELERAEAKAEAANRQKQEADLKRATNFNLRELNRAESRAVGGAGSINFGQGSSRSGPSALIIRDALSPASSGVRVVSVNTAATTGDASRRGPKNLTGHPSVRRINARRVTNMIIANGAPGQGGSGVPDVTCAGDRSYRRGNSRFLEGAVAGPRISPPRPMQELAKALSEEHLNGVGTADLDDVAVLLPPPPALPSQQQEGSNRGLPGTDGTEADDERGSNLLDPDFTALASGAQASGAPAAVEPENEFAANGNGAEGHGQQEGPRLREKGQQPPAGIAGGDALIEAATFEALAAESAVDDWATAAGGSQASGPSSPVLQRQRQQPSPLPLSTRTSGNGMMGTGPLSPAARSLSPRRSPLSRGATGGPSMPLGPNGGLYGMGSTPMPLSRFGASASMSNIADSEAVAAAVAKQEMLSGMPSDPELRPARQASTGEGDRAGLLQSLLVIKPGAGGRMRGISGVTGGLPPGSSVRLVQRLGDDGARGSALEALRTDGAAGNRALGRGAVRPSGASATGPIGSGSGSGVQPQGDFNQRAGERSLGRTSLTGPSAGRALGRSSSICAPIQENSRKHMPHEPPSLGPFEFALPEDMGGAGAPFPNPFANPAANTKDAFRGPEENGSLVRQSLRQQSTAGGSLGRSSVLNAVNTEDRTGAGGGAGGALGRSSVRTGGPAGGSGGGGGGGALTRGSIRLGRQAGLAAASAQLARIYDVDAGDGGPIRPSGNQVDYPVAPVRSSFAFEGTRSHADAAPGSPVPLAPGSPNRRHASALSQPQSSLTFQAPLLPQTNSAQHFLGAASRGAALSSLQRSTSRPGSTIGTAGPSGPGSVRDLSGRGTEGVGLARRTRFADSNTAIALARASTSGAFYQQQQDVEGGSYSVCAPLLVEYRMRLLAGLKQYYRQKHAAGSLSDSSYKVLSYVADQSAHHPEKPLDLWTMVKQEVSNGPLLQAEATVYFKLKHWTAAAKASSSPLVRGVVPRLLVPFVALLSLHISATTLSGLETAVELWASLTQSLQTEWLQYSGLYGELLLEEVQHEADGAWQYIIERRIEAPNKFGAVQTHRAVIDVLTQQQAFVREMNEGGMIDESECRKIVDVVERRLQMLARNGPRWRQPTIMEILSGTAVLRGVPTRVVEWIRKNSTMQLYQQGAAIWDMGRKKAGAEPDGLIIVIRGVVRMMLEQDGALVPYYLGAGGVGGLVSCVLEAHVPGMSSAAAYAEGNAMGKGPVVMHVPWAVLQVLRRFSREERLAPYQALDLQLYRTAAVYVLDLLRHQVTQQFSIFFRSSLLAILGSERLDGPTVKRQRIRLLLQPAASDHHIDGGIDWIGELMAQEMETARKLLEPPLTTSGAAITHHNSAGAAAPVGANGSQHSHASNHSHMSAHSVHVHVQGHLTQLLGNSQRYLAPPPSPWVEAMYKAIAAATNAVLDVIRTSLKDSIMVVLGPGQGIIQRTTMVLIQGSLEPACLARADGRGNPGGPFVASSNESHVAPSVMVWVSDYFEGQLVSQKELEVVAGPRGATLLLWGVEPEDFLLPSPKETSLESAAAPEAAAAVDEGPGPAAGPVGGTVSTGLPKVRSNLKLKGAEISTTFGIEGKEEAGGGEAGVATGP